MYCWLAFAYDSAVQEPKPLPIVNNFRLSKHFVTGMNHLVNVSGPLICKQKFHFNVEWTPNRIVDIPDIPMLPTNSFYNISDLNGKGDKWTGHDSERDSFISNSDTRRAERVDANTG